MRFSVVVVVVVFVCLYCLGFLLLFFCVLFFSIFPGDDDNLKSFPIAGFAMYIGKLLFFFFFFVFLMLLFFMTVFCMLSLFYVWVHVP